jgi:hypothetical protein
MGVRGVALCAAIVVALAVAPAAALGASSDAAATDAYLRANLTLVSTSRAKLRTSESELRVLERSLGRECPGVIVGSPQNEESEKLTWEAIGAMTIAGYQVFKPAIARFTRAVAHLRWSNPKLTSAVRTYARQILTEVSTPAPDLCGDLRAWGASGYRTLPANTLSFYKTFYTVFVGVGELPSQFATRSAKASVVQRTKRLELELREGEARAVETFGRIIDSLGLHQ